MNSILSKLSKDELKELSKLINEAQKEVFGNSLSLRKQEQFMAKVFKVKDWSTLLGRSKEYDPDSDYQRTIIQVEVLSNGFFPDMSLEEISNEIVNGDSTGEVKYLLRESLTKEAVTSACQRIGSGPSFLIGEEPYKPKKFSTKQLIILEKLFDDLQETEAYKEDRMLENLALLMEENYKNLRDNAITKFNRMNEDSELDKVSKFEKVLIEDKVILNIDDFVDYLFQVDVF